MERSDFDLSLVFSLKISIHYLEFCFAGKVLSMHSLLQELITLLFAAVLFVPIFRYFGVGAILAYLFAGAVIGPEFLSLITEPKSILHFSELGVVFLLFLIGLELEPSRLWAMRKEVFGLGLSQMFLTGGVFTGIGHLLGFSLAVSFVAGFGLALSSTAFCLQILEEKHQLKTLHGQGTFSILLFQDIAVVPLITLVPVLAGASAGASWLGVGKTFAIIIAFIAVGIFAIRHIFHFIARARVQEVFTAVSLLVVLGSAVIMEEAGLSMGTGAFLAGVLLANSEYRHELESNLSAFKGLLLGLFFMAVGMSLDFNILLAKPLEVAGLLIAFMLIKNLIVFGLAMAFKFPKESARNIAFTLPQGGEFAFVLFASAASFSLFDDETAAILNAVVTISMAVTPALFSLNQKYIRSYSDITERPYDSKSDEEVEVIIAGYGRFGQIVSRFLRSQKVAFTVLEHSAAQVDIARKYGTKIFYGDASRHDIVESAGGEKAKIFVLAIDDPVTSVATAKMVKEYFPNLEIIARVRNRKHAIDLLKLGIENVHRETYLTSLEVAKEVLLSRGGIREQINRKLALFRSHDEKILRKQLDIIDDEKQMISITSSFMDELDQILRQDMEDDSAS
ncbi:MAG: monovalent cation:proton antiporter-2 (CPA2) family protein [Bdellovibrionota bacterium]